MPFPSIKSADQVVLAELRSRREASALIVLSAESDTTRLLMLSSEGSTLLIKAVLIASLVHTQSVFGSHKSDKHIRHLLVFSEKAGTR